MKTFISTLFFVFILVTGYSQSGYSIRGKIKGWHDTVCYLGNHYGDKKYVKDTTKIDKNGNYVFKGKEKLPGGIYLIVFPNKMYFEILIDREQKFYVETDTFNVVADMKIKGSEDNILFYKYLRFISQKQKEKEPLVKGLEKIKEDTLAAHLKNDSVSASWRLAPSGKAWLDSVKDAQKIFQEKIIAIDKEVEAYQNNFMKEHPDSFLSVIFKAQKEPSVPDAPMLPNGRKDSLFTYFYYKKHYWDNIPLTDDRILRTPVFYPKLKYFFDKVVVQSPDSVIKEGDIIIDKTAGNKEMFKYIIYYMTYTYETSNIMGMDAVFVHLVEKYYETKKAFWVDSVQIQKIIHRGLTLKPLLLEKPAPPVIMQDTSDKNISLYDLKAKYIVLIFWEPDCGHCQKIVPKLKEIYEKTLKSKGVEVFAVNIEYDDDKWKNFIKEKNLEWVNVHDKYHAYFLRQLYDIYSTPVIYLLDENKKIKAKRIDADQLSGFIEFLERKNK